MTENYVLQPIPYLAFDGNCAEALDFYAALFDGKVVSKTTYGDMPADTPCSDSAKDRLANEIVELPGGGFLYGGDTPPGLPFERVSGMMLTLNFPSIELAQKVFDGLAAEGKVSMPFEPAFWAERFGMVTDKYGIDWGINAKLAVPS